MDRLGLVIRPLATNFKSTGQLRFSFASDGESRFIQDRQNPASRIWRIPGRTYTPGITGDYALITRIHDPTAGRYVVMAGVLQQQGTRAAGEFLSGGALLDEARRFAPGDWRRKNIQVVLGTRVIGQNAGRPHVLAAYIW